jgi:alkanesulfonate monooxygenase SsuD/methylene tetrahydromethanopterin reductase-like flavin-dependent oxidoreductase (luciferase family)
MGVGIGLGCAEFPFSGATAYWRWVDTCEAGGVDSIWQTDRIVGRQPFLESMTTMAALAGRTRRMRFCMNVVSLTFRDPVLLAKQCATIDMLSEGRLLPAFGIGSPLAPEWQALGIDTKTRGRKTDECLDIIRRLWREESVDFSGAFYQLKGVTIAPKPVHPDLPMWIGGSTDAAIRRTARVGTGWQAGGDPPAEAGRVVAAIKAAANRSRPIHRGRSLWRRLRVPLRQPGRACGQRRWTPTPNAPGVTPRTRSRSATPIRFLRALPIMSTPACRSSFCGHSAAMTTPFWPRPVS